MVFSTTNLFKGIRCPYGEECGLTNCIFNHDLRPQKSPPAEASTVEPLTTRDKARAEPAPKRRKVTYEHASQKPPSKADQIRSQLAATRTFPAVNTGVKQHSLQDNANRCGSESQPTSLTRTISPPPTNGNVSASRATNNSRSENNNKHDIRTGRSELRSSSNKFESATQEHLHPRTIPHDPAGYAKRSLYLKHLRDSMALLNDRVRASSLEHKRLLVLTEQELIKMALSEEEKIAREQPTVYANIIKNRIAAYKKMQIDDWTRQVKASFARDQPTPPPVNKTVKPIQTDLTSSEELLILPYLVADQSKLIPYGYIPTPPTEAEAAKAAAAVEAAKNYEVCDRCSSRFQVFPERNEEGLLASNGPCKHHPNRKVYPPRTKGDNAQGNLKEPYYPCCNGVVGSPGCTEKDYHVFKASEPSRLAAVLPFITTPENDSPAKGEDGKTVRAVSFDCEMGYTVYGLELIRLTAVSWPSGDKLIDVLVRPLGTVIDLNSRFSGVWPEHFTNAIPYDQYTINSSLTTDSTSLPIVSSPQEARKLLCSYLTPDTPLIGHAIDNDLNAVRLCQPTIVDTVVLFPHPRELPMRYGLKMLASRHLSRSIQNGGDRGHDSVEDAVATGDLVRFKVGKEWGIMRAKGWMIVNGRLVEPEWKAGIGKSRMEVELDREAGEVGGAAGAGAGEGLAGKKRRKRFAGSDGAAGNESTEDEEVSWKEKNRSSQLKALGT